MARGFPTRPGIRTHNPIPRVPAKVQSAGETPQQAQEEQIVQAQQAVTPQGSPVTTTGLLNSQLQKQVNTPQGLLIVNFTQKGNTIIPTSIGKNLTFSSPINATSGNLALTGTETFTYALKGNQIVATPTNQSGQITYSGTPIANVGKGGVVSIIPGSSITVPQYGAVSGNTQFLGNIVETPSYSNGQFNFNYASFQPATVTVTGKTQIPSNQGGLQTIGYQFPATTSYNISTGQININPNNVFYGSPLELPANYLGTSVTTSLFPKPNNSPTISPSAFNFAGQPTGLSYSTNPSFGGSFTSSGLSFSTPYQAINYNYFNATNPSTSTPQQLTAQYISSGTKFLGTSTSFSASLLRAPYIGSGVNQLFQFEQGTGYSILQTVGSIALTPYLQGKAYAQANPNASIIQKASAIGQYNIQNLETLGLSSTIVYPAIQGIRTQGVTKTAEQFIGSVILFGGIGKLISGTNVQLNPEQNLGIGSEGATLIGTRAQITETYGVVATKGTSLETTNFEQPLYSITSINKGQLGSIEFRGGTQITYSKGATTIEATGVAPTITTSLGGGKEQTLVTGGSADIIATTSATTGLRNFLGISPKVTITKFTIPVAQSVVSLSTENPTGLLIREQPIYPGELLNSFQTGEAGSGESSILTNIGKTSSGNEFSGLSFKVTGFSKNGELTVAPKQVFLFENTNLPRYAELANPAALAPIDLGYTGVKGNALDIYSSKPEENNPSSSSQTSILGGGAGTKTSTKGVTQTLNINLGQAISKLQTSTIQQTKFEEAALTVPFNTQSFTAIQSSKFKLSTVFSNPTTTKLIQPTTYKLPQTTTSKYAQPTTTKNILTPSFKTINTPTFKTINTPSFKTINSTSLKTAQSTTQKTATTQKTSTVVSPENPLKGIEALPFIFNPGRSGKAVKKKQQTKTQFDLTFGYVADLAHSELNVGLRNRKQKLKLGKIAFSRPL